MINRLPAALAAVMMIGIVLCLGACSTPGLPGTFFDPSITRHMHNGTAHVHARLGYHVGDPHPSGTVTIALYHRVNRFHKWQFSGRAHKGNPWISGNDGSLDVWYPCIQSKHKNLRWMMKVVWDGARSDGTPTSGTRHYPNKTGQIVDCS
jgi:hypothetical protein